MKRFYNMDKEILKKLSLEKSRFIIIMILSVWYLVLWESNDKMCRIVLKIRSTVQKERSRTKNQTKDIEYRFLINNISIAIDLIIKKNICDYFKEFSPGSNRIKIEVYTVYKEQHWKGSKFDLKNRQSNWNNMSNE